MRVAYRLIDQQSVVTYSIKTFLRLPKYLQLAGKNDEAWAEYQKLLISRVSRNREMMPMDMSLIYDSMRIHLQREKRSVLAVRFAIWSAVCWYFGLRAQKRKDEYEVWLTESHIIEILKNPLKKASKEDKLEHLTALILNEVGSRTKYTATLLGELAEKVDLLLKE